MRRLLALALAAARAPADRAFAPSSLSMLWSTPVLSAPAQGVDVEAIAVAVQSGLEVYADQNPGLRDSGLRDGLNEAFFRMQRGRFEASAQGLSEWLLERLGGSHFEALERTVRAHASGYLRSVGWPAEDHPEALRRATIFMWATAASAHLPHIHPDATVSGVLYLRVPAGAAPIILEDPRGSVPPFGKRVIHDPEPGELLMFPPWLSHMVPAGAGAATCAESRGGVPSRLSLAFNVLLPGDLPLGGLEATADASLALPLARSPKR